MAYAGKITENETREVSQVKAKDVKIGDLFEYGGLVYVVKNLKRFGKRVFIFGSHEMLGKVEAGLDEELAESGINVLTRAKAKKGKSRVV